MDIDLPVAPQLSSGADTAACVSNIKPPVVRQQHPSDEEMAARIGDIDPHAVPQQSTADTEMAACTSDITGLMRAMSTQFDADSVDETFFADGNRFVDVAQAFGLMDVYHHILKTCAEVRCSAIFAAHHALPIPTGSRTQFPARHVKPF